jgi:outer membrane lipoprotein-sorting protein
VKRAIETLAAGQNDLHNFKARARFSIESPDLERRQSFRGNLAVEMPDKVRLVSNGAFGRKLFDLISVGKTFLLYYPSEQKVFFEKEGVEVESLPFSVSPSDIVKELFLPEDWACMRFEDVKVVSPGGRRMVIAVYSDGRLTRKLWVQRPRWWLVRDELYAEDGTLRALTVFERYREIGGMWLPTHLEAHYPQRETRMVMQISNVEVNSQLDPAMFVFPTKLLLMAERQRRESDAQNR